MVSQYGNDLFPGDDRAVILWLSDSPSLNEQTMKRFDRATDLLSGATTMEAIGPEFAKNHRKLMPGHVYFLNRQLKHDEQVIATKEKSGHQFEITEDYLLDFIHKNQNLSDMLHQFRGY